VQKMVVKAGMQSQDPYGTLLEIFSDFGSMTIRTNSSRIDPKVRVDAQGFVGRFLSVGVMHNGRK